MAKITTSEGNVELMTIGVMIGSSIFDCKRESVRLAVEYDCAVTFVHNDTKYMFDMINGWNILPLEKETNGN